MEVRETYTTYKDRLIYVALEDEPTKPIQRQ